MFCLLNVKQSLTLAKLMGKKEEGQIKKFTNKLVAIVKLSVFSSCIFSNAKRIFAFRGTRTLMPKALVPKTSVSTNSTRKALTKNAFGYKKSIFCQSVVLLFIFFFCSFSTSDWNQSCIYLATKVSTCC